MRLIQKTLILAGITTFFLYALPGMPFLFTSPACAANKTSTAAGTASRNASKPADARVYAVQAASCLDEEGAWSLVEELAKKNIQADVYSLKDRKGRMWHVVIAGAYATPSSAKASAGKLRDTAGVSPLIVPYSKNVLKRQKLVHPAGAAKKAIAAGPAVKKEKTFPAKAYSVQVSACLNEESARTVASRLTGKGYTPELLSLAGTTGQPWHLVLLGFYDTLAGAEKAAQSYREREQDEAIVKIFDGELPGKVKQAVKEEPGTAETPPAGTPAAGSAETKPEEVSAPEEAEATAEETEAPAEVKKEEPAAEEEKGEEEAAETEEGAKDEEGEGGEENPVEFSYHGAVEMENVISADEELDFKEANKKNEIRNRLEVKYGTDQKYLFSVSDVYLALPYFREGEVEDYVYSEDTEIGRNLRISSRESEIAFDELYLNYGVEKMRLRVGNQIYGWGTADAFNPTSYFNPFDLRELIFKDDDEFKEGIPSVSAMFFLRGATLETVFAPVHVPMLMAPQGNFWYVNIDDYFFPVIVEEPEALDVRSKHFGYGARLSSSYMGMDFSFSAYHGPDREPVFVPWGTVLTPNDTIALLVKPKDYIVTMVGFDFSATLGEFVVQTECAYSSDKRGLVKQDLNDYDDLQMPFDTEKSDFFSYAVGFNYFIPLNRLIEGHEGDTVFTFEWFQSKFFDDDVYRPILTDLVTCRFEDGYFDNRVKVKITGVFDARHGGQVFWPEFTYDFLNGLTVTASYAGIWGRGISTWDENSMFHYLKDNDFYTVRVRYEY
ncbi:MAG: SPOR domain-containing protein [Deltaproteobacteria bacterium]|nr:SPOR domain-containing protein [Deltaproteobacteria bacterium]